MLDYAAARRNMVDCQLRTFDVTDRAVLAAMGDIPREQFMPTGKSALAYLDQNVSLADKGEAQRAMLQPMVLARLIQALNIEAGARVLDVASGLGYSSALLALLGAHVLTLEADEELAARCRTAISEAGFGATVEVRTGPLAKGAPDQAPFRAIVINGAVEEEPVLLLEQLSEMGRLACLRADRRTGAVYATLYVRGAGGIGSRRLFDASAPILSEFRARPAFSF